MPAFDPCSDGSLFDFSILVFNGVWLFYLGEVRKRIASSASCLALSKPIKGADLGSQTKRISMFR